MTADAPDPRRKGDRPPPGGVTRVFRGYLTLAPNPAAPGASPFLGALGTGTDDESPDEASTLAGQLARAADRLGRDVAVRYVVGRDRHEADPDDAFGPGWTRLRGRAEADAATRPGTDPGRWVVCETFAVGGTDLIAGLKAHGGKFCHLEITFSQGGR